MVEARRFFARLAGSINVFIDKRQSLNAGIHKTKSTCICVEHKF